MKNQQTITKIIFQLKYVNKLRKLKYMKNRNNFLRI
jgi:hypothetical protein